MQGVIGTSDDTLPCCLADRAPASASLPRGALDDEEGTRVPDDLPLLVDAHVHVFPDRLFDAVWRWFDRFGWPIRYKLYADQVVAHLTSRGVRDVVLLHYAHRPGLARSMNAFVAELAARHGVTAVGTVFPGEPDQQAIVEEAFALGLRGLKLHCHVQGVPVDDARLFPVYAACAERSLPVVVHAGREPRPSGEGLASLPADPHVICGAERTARVLRAFPTLKLCVPHLGADEYPDYRELVLRHDNLWLDTTMMLAGYFDAGDPWPVVRARPDRVLYGSDFPNLPYAWDREARALAAARLPDGDLERLCAGNARTLFGLAG
ncbi:MAG: amidohydrolase [Deltaproteobacteria bacterium]|nr:amidohydrolase [Deltaproteobacteria bacterium]